MRYCFDDYDDEGFKIRWLADCIRKDICKALQPKPEKVHYDYWVVYPYDYYPEKNVSNMRNHLCYRDLDGYRIDFPTFEEALSYCEKRFGLNLVKLYSFPYLSWYDDGDLVYEDIDQENKTLSSNNLAARKLYLFHHAVYDSYADYVLELEDESIKFMKEAYKQLRIADIYQKCIDVILKTKEGLPEDYLLEKFKEDMELLEKELSEIDWTKPEFPEEEEEEYEDQDD